jgi:hypothetical protein
MLFILFIFIYLSGSFWLWRYYKLKTVILPYTLAYPPLPHKFLFGPLSLIEGDFYGGRSFAFYLVCTFIVFALAGAVFASKRRSSRIAALALFAIAWCVLGLRIGGFILG